MHAPHRTRRALTLLLAAIAFILGATAEAWADDAKPDDEVGQTATETETVIVTKDGTKTLRLRADRDGRFVVEPADETGGGTRMHVIVRKGDGDEDVQVLELRDGRWVASERPVQVEREVAVRRHAARRDPMETMLRWLLLDGMASETARDPLKQWFEGGSDVPLAGLRDALRADGWTAERLEAWLLDHALGGLAALDAPPPAPRPVRRIVRRPARGRWFEVGRAHARCGACGCDGQCGRRRLCDDCASRMDRCEGCGRTLARQERRAARAFLLWNDGSGWRHREVDAPGRDRQPGHGPGGMTFHEEGPDAASELEHVLRALMGERTNAPESAEIEIETFDLLPPELLEQVPPEILERVRKELQGLGLGDLLAPPKRDCDDCPQKGACKGGGCGKAGGAKSDGCSGTCGGDCKGTCEDCPRAKDGSCPGDCEGCAKRKADGDAK